MPREGCSRVECSSTCSCRVCTFSNSISCLMRSTALSSMGSWEMMVLQVVLHDAEAEALALLGGASRVALGAAVTGRSAAACRRH